MKSNNQRIEDLEAKIEKMDLKYKEHVEEIEEAIKVLALCVNRETKYR